MGNPKRRDGAIFLGLVLLVTLWLAVLVGMALADLVVTGVA